MTLKIISLILWLFVGFVNLQDKYVSKWSYFIAWFGLLFFILVSIVS